MNMIYDSDKNRGVPNGTIAKSWQDIDSNDDTNDRFIDLIKNVAKGGNVNNRVRTYAGKAQLHHHACRSLFLDK